MPIYQSFAVITKICVDLTCLRGLFSHITLFNFCLDYIGSEAVINNKQMSMIW